MKIVGFLVFVGLIVYFLDLPDDLGKLHDQVLDLMIDEPGRRMVFVIGLFAIISIILV